MTYPFTKSLEHHGLIAGFCKEIDLANIIDQALGTSEHRQVGFGHLFVAMIINGLGFTGRTLHMYSEYFSGKLLDRLIVPGIKADHINDDALGRCLDALYQYGVSPLYQDIGEAVVKHLELPYESVHLNSTSFHYDGSEKLSDNDDDLHYIQITKGYSRDDLMFDGLCVIRASDTQKAKGKSSPLPGSKEKPHSKPNSSPGVSTLPGRYSYLSGGTIPYGR